MKCVVLFALVPLLVSCSGATVAESAAPVAPSTAPAASASPAQTTPPYTPPPFRAEPSDFVVDVHVLEKKCFGSAGCNVTYQIEPLYKGVTPLPSSGETTVTYEVKGAEDQIINTFTIRGTQVTFDSEERTQTKRSGDELTAEATRVVYRP